VIRIGAGAGYSGDRIEPAIELAEKGALDYLVFECLAERTIALAQLAKARDPAAGYDPLLGERMEAVLAPCRARGVRIVTNAGAANPRAAGERVCDVARAHGQRGVRIAVVTGDDVLELLRLEQALAPEARSVLEGLGDRVISANAYIGSGPIAEALAGGAHVVVTGRAADPSLFLAPLVHAFGWRADDWDRLGQGTLVGHLLECAGQVTGGYFADPGAKDVPGLARLGFPLAEVAEDGSAVVTKVDGSGGRVSEATCKEQLLYEIHDPAAYATPDVIADFSGVVLSQVGPDRVAVRGARGRARPGRLKVAVGYRDGFVGEGQISYAGPGAVARGRLALEIVAERLKLIGAPLRELRCDLIGKDALHGSRLSSGAVPYEVRARVVARADTASWAGRVGREVEALYTNGPAGGGGASQSVREVIGIAAVFLPRERVVTRVEYLEA
jgi:hypothetical protein